MPITMFFDTQQTAKEGLKQHLITLQSRLNRALVSSDVLLMGHAVWFLQGVCIVFQEENEDLKAKLRR